MFQRHTIPVTAFEQNCSLVWCDETQQAALIDPGGDIPKLLAAVKARGRNGVPMDVFEPDSQPYQEATLRTL